MNLFYINHKSYKHNYYPPSHNTQQIIEPNSCAVLNIIIYLRYLIEFVKNILVGIMVITGIHQVGRKSIEIKSTIVKFFIFNDEPLP